MAGPCVVEGCDFVGKRLLCYEHGGSATALDFAMCTRHYRAHKRTMHGEALPDRVCTRCKKPLTDDDNERSPAGAPWCGACPIWWHR